MPTATPKTIYVVEDDPAIQTLEKTALSREGYSVLGVSTGKAFKEAFGGKRPDLVILDLMLPDIQGEDLLHWIRSNPMNDEVQVVIVSAKNQLADRVGNLDMGADDYIEKPFDILEFLARINARFRLKEAKSKVQAGDILIDIKAHKTFFKGKELKLTNAEYILLSELVNNAGNVVSRKALVEKLWGGTESLETRTIDIHVNNIRKKLDDDDGNLIQTVYGVGYRIAGGKTTF